MLVSRLVDWSVFNSTFNIMLVTSLL